MSRFGAGCLGDRAAALVDGELGEDARDLALAHLARCDACRAEVATQRRLKARLSGLDGPHAPGGLLERLSGIAADASEPVTMGAADDRAGDDRAGGDRAVPARPPRRRAGVGARASERLPGRPPARPADRTRRAASSRARHRVSGVRVAVVGGVSLVALSMSAFMLGGQGGPSVVPPVDHFTLEHASTTQEVPFGQLPALPALPASTVGFATATAGSP